MKTFAGCQKVADFAQSFLKNWKNVVLGYSAEIIKYMVKLLGAFDKPESVCNKETTRKQDNDTIEGVH